MTLVAQMIRSKRFFEFVNEFVAIRNEEIDEKTQWEFWLHKDFERSFAEFRDQFVRSNGTPNTISKEEQIAILKESRNMIDNFIPDS